MQSGSGRMEQPQKQRPPQTDVVSPKDFLEIVWKGAAGLSAACYLIGFIVANIHLSRFGYYSVSLVSAQYLTAGVWAFIPVALGWYFVLHVLRDEVAQDSFITKPAVLLFLTIGTGVSFLLLALFSEWIGRLALLPRWTVVIVTGFFASMPTVVLFRWLTPLRSLTKEWMLTVVSAAFALLFAMVYLNAFSRNLYGDIPGTAGGGKPRLVRLVVKSEAKEDLAAAGISLIPGLRTSESLNLLVATEKEYILQTGKGDLSVSIRSDVVQAVLYEGR